MHHQIALTASIFIHFMKGRKELNAPPHLKHCIRPCHASVSIATFASRSTVCVKVNYAGSAHNIRPWLRMVLAQTSWKITNKTADHHHTQFMESIYFIDGINCQCDDIVAISVEITTGILRREAGKNAF